MFAEIGNSLVDCTNDNRGRKVPDQVRLEKCHFEVVKDALLLNFGDNEFFNDLVSEEYAQKLYKGKAEAIE